MNFPQTTYKLHYSPNSFCITDIKPKIKCFSSSSSSSLRMISQGTRAIIPGRSETESKQNDQVREQGAR